MLPFFIPTCHLFIEEEGPGQERGEEGAQAEGEVEGVHVGPRVPAIPDAKQQRVTPSVKEPRAKALRWRIDNIDHHAMGTLTLKKAQM